jgi:hypothetical protein
MSPVVRQPLASDDQVVASVMATPFDGGLHWRAR